MITFITSYDESTISNYNVTHTSVPVGAINLLGNAASRNNLIANLTAIPAVPVFIASHGSEIGIYSEIDLIALSIDNSNLFNNRNVYVYACYTANKLGRVSSNGNCIYWGYTGAISALVDDPFCIHYFREIFEFVINQFHNCTSRNSIVTFINDLKNMCDLAESHFDTLFEQEPNFDVMTAYTCTKDIWNRLRVFLQNENDQIVHVDAEIGDLFQY